MELAPNPCYSGGS